MDWLHGKSETDVVIVGAGLGGLCCGALLARYGYRVVICEAHVIAGGVAHSFERGGYHFDSGPSWLIGLSQKASANPLKQVLDLLGEELPCIRYDKWFEHLPEGLFTTVADADAYAAELERFAGAEGLAQWRRLEARMHGLASAVAALPAAALRFDRGAILTLGRRPLELLKVFRQAKNLARSFSDYVGDELTHPFLLNMMDLESFVLSGLKADATLAPEMAFMYRERHQSTVDYPIGGMQAIVDALVRGLEKFGGELVLGAQVKEILVDKGRATGVRLRRGGEIRANEAVVSNASVWDTLRLLPDDALPPEYRERRAATPQCESFLHLHLGIDAAGLDDLECHHLVLDHWKVRDPQNAVIISIPSVFDPSMAPPGKHAVHAYAAGNEPYEIWQGMNHKSDAYKALKKERVEPLYTALERVIPDIRDRVELELIGTPLTVERFCRRDSGSYGPAIAAGKQRFPGPRWPVDGLLHCGDSTAPGIGVPSVAASGMAAANTIAPVHKHLQLLRDLERLHREGFGAEPVIWRSMQSAVT